MSNIYPIAPGRLNFGGPAGQTRLKPLRQGSTFRRPLSVPSIDLTGHQLRCSIRRDFEDRNPIVFLSTGNGRIQLNLPHGFVMELGPEITETIEAAPGLGERYVYDIELIAPNGDVHPLLEGELYVVAEVTKEADT